MGRRGWRKMAYAKNEAMESSEVLAPFIGEAWREAPRWQTEVCAMTGLGRLPSHPFVINHW